MTIGALFSRALPVTLGACGLLPLVVACAPRAPGPEEAEYGEVFYWEVTGSALEVGERCTDNPAFADGLEPPEFEDNTYLMYLVEGDGERAVLQSCDTLDPSTCEDSELGLVFDIDGNDLVADPDPAVRDVENSPCDLEVDERWVVEDRGETMEMTMEVGYNLVGDAATCDALEAQVKADAPNGQGLNGCVLTLVVDGVFDRSSAP